MLTIREYLKNQILLFDGAVGTYYSDIKHYPGKSVLAALKHPDELAEIHREYLQAGAKAITTHTFQANTVSLGRDFDYVAELITAAYKIACKEAAAYDAYVFADMGTIPGESDAALTEYKQIIDQFVSLGAKHFIMETFSDDTVLPDICSYIKEKQPDSFILASFAVMPDGFTSRGYLGLSLMKQLLEDGHVDAVGYNCVTGPRHMRELLENADFPDSPIVVMPNAGYPTVLGNHVVYGGTADYFAKELIRMAELGANIIGGCCGTTPEYIRQAAELLKASNIDPAKIKTSGKKNTTAQEGTDEKDGLQGTLIHLPKDEFSNDESSGKNSSVGKSSEDKSGISDLTVNPNTLADKLSKGKKVIAVELDPPLDSNVDKFLTGAKKLKAAGIDALTIADCPIARSRMDSSILACKLKRELDIEPLPHMTCRDRNLNATKALLLGLSMEGVHNVLVITGDPIPSAERDEVKSVFNFNSRMLMRYISGLNESLLKTPFQIGGALNINATNFDVQLKLAKQKVENGCSVFLTQPIYGPQAEERIAQAHEELDAKILGGIMPIVSHRNACFMNNEIAGINIPEEIVSLYEDKTKEECTELAVRLSVETAKRIEPYIDGYYFMTPFSRTDIICRIIEEIR